MNDTASPENDLFATLKRPDRSGRPKYQRLAQTLIEGIKRGVWGPGDRLPAEETLTTMTPFSLGTVQRALEWRVLAGVGWQRQCRGPSPHAFAERRDRGGR